jgi:hypothetical protein
MTVKINVGPPVLTINRGSTFMVTDYRGQIDPLQAQGVFADDTGFVSGYRLWINGKPWERISSAAVSYHSDRLYLTNPLFQAAFGDKAGVGPSALELKLAPGGRRGDP